MSRADEQILSMDRNADGRLSADEYVRGVEASLARNAAAQAVSPCGASAPITSERLEGHFANLRREYGALFPNGLETPSDAQFNRIAGYGAQVTAEFSQLSPSAALARAGLMPKAHDGMDGAFDAFLEEARRRRLAERDGRSALRV